jgi:hypothetical protein
VTALILAAAGTMAVAGSLQVIYERVFGQQHRGWRTMHFLLAGRVPWRRLIHAAVLTALLWVGLELFSAVYFSAAIISDSRLYDRRRLHPADLVHHHRRSHRARGRGRRGLGAAERPPTRNQARIIRPGVQRIPPAPAGRKLTP